MEFEEVKRVRTLRAPCRNIPQKENEEARGSFCLDPSVILVGLKFPSIYLTYFLKFKPIIHEKLLSNLLMNEAE